MVIARDSADNGAEVNCSRWDRAKRRNHDDDELNLDSVESRARFHRDAARDKRVPLRQLLLISMGRGRVPHFQKQPKATRKRIESKANRAFKATLTCWLRRFYRPRRNDHSCVNRTRSAALQLNLDFPPRIRGRFLSEGRSPVTTKCRH